MLMKSSPHARLIPHFNVFERKAMRRSRVLMRRSCFRRSIDYVSDFGIHAFQYIDKSLSKLFGLFRLCRKINSVLVGILSKI